MCSFACSVVLWRGRGTEDKCHWRVWGALSVFWPHWVYPRSQNVFFPHLHCSGSRLLYREWALCCVYFPGLSCSGSGFWVLHKDADWVGPVFCAFPGRSNSGSQELDEHTLPGTGCLITSAVPASGFVLVQCAFCLFWEADFCCAPAGRCQPSRISGRLWSETGSLFAVW